jgi:hypothetical protein
VVSVGLVFHLAAMVAIALAGRPASTLEAALAEPFAPYAELIHQGHTHRYYAPVPPPTPIVTAEVRDAEGRVVARRRLPDRATRPRLRYQRELALAYHLFADHQLAASAGRRGIWGPSYARHLLARTPGGVSVTLWVQQHLVPDLVRLRGEGPIDPDDEQFYTVPEVVVRYPEEDGPPSEADEDAGSLPPPVPAVRVSPFARPGS